MYVFFLIVGCLTLAISQICLLLHNASLTRRLEKVEAFIKYALPALFPFWLERKKDAEVEKAEED